MNLSNCKHSPALQGKALIAVTLLIGVRLILIFFHAWLKDRLRPNIPAKSMIVMDKTAFHQPEDAQRLMIEVGHMIECLPPDSPDLNHIEQPIG